MNFVGINSFTHVPHAIVLKSSEHMITKRTVFVLENIRLNVTASCFGAVCYQLMVFGPCTSLNC